MSSTTPVPPGPEDSEPEAKAGPSSLHRTSSNLSLATTLLEDEDKTDIVDEDDWSDSMSAASQSMTSVTDPLEGISFEHTEPECSSTPQIARTQPMPSSSRKRDYTFSDDEDSVSMSSSISTQMMPAKRQRLRRHPSNMSFEYSYRLRESTTRSPSTRSLRSFGHRDDPRPFTGPRPTRPRLLSASSSHSDLSALLPPASEQDMFTSVGLDMMRQCLEAGTRTSSRASSPTPPDTSAKFHMRASKVTIDFSVSATAPPPATPTHANANVHGNASLHPTAYVSPVSWSYNNVLAFSRGNRVHMRSFQFGTSDETMQFCKITKDAGDLRLLSWAGREKTGTLALAATRGTVQVWDVNAKQKTASWRVPSGITALVWEGPVLTMAGNRGLMRQYDTRTDSRQLVKVRPKGGDRDKHWAPVRSLAFNHDGTKLLSGDDSGMVYIWDSRTWGKQSFGETALHYQRRIQHPAAVRALAWCPWKHQMFACADAGENTSTLRIYDIERQSAPKEPPPLLRRRSLRLAPEAPATDPNDEPLYSITYDAAVTSIHWSELAKEILTTHGPGRMSTEPPLVNGVVAPPQPAKHASAVAVWSMTSKKEISVLSAGDTGISGSCLSPNGQRIVLVMPEEKKLKIWDVWKPSLKRSDSKLSFMHPAIR